MQLREKSAWKCQAHWDYRVRQRDRQTQRQTDPETVGQLDRQVWVDSGTVGASNVENGKEVGQLQETWEVKGNVNYYIVYSCSSYKCV